MKRIDFLRRLFTGGSAVITGGYAFAGKAEKKPDIYLDSLYIAGFQYYKGPGLEKILTEGEPLSLKRDATNPYDYFAVEIYRGDRKLGFLSRSDNRIIARMMDQGMKLKAVIRSVDLKGHPYRRVKVRVYSGGMGEGNKG